MFFFVGIDTVKIADTVLVSMFEKKLLEGTILLKHWAGRNSRGVSQFEGAIIHDLILNPSSNIDISRVEAFLQEVVSLAN